jgi:hypothetical protein
MLVAPLSIKWDLHLHELFLERIGKSKNTKSMKWIGTNDFARVDEGSNEKKRSVLIN